MSASSTIIEEIETLRKAGLASVAMFFYDFGEDQRRTYVDRYHRCYPSFATGPIPTTKSFDFQFNTPSWCTEPQQRRNCYMFKGLVESPRTSADLPSPDCRRVGRMSKYIGSVIPPREGPSNSGGLSQLATPEPANMRN
jgi:hypothetical protein